jgi:GxxExxY protein
VKTRLQCAREDVLADRLSYRIIGCALEVHRVLGAGLLEGAYEEFLCQELLAAGLSIVRQRSLPVTYKGNRVELGYKPDIVVNKELIVELKTVTQLLPIHSAQLLTYMRLAGIERGLLINFHATSLKNGIKRLVLSRDSASPSRLPRSSR